MKMGKKYFCSLYDITEKGNFEGKSIPNLLAKMPDLSPDGGSGLDQAGERGIP